MPDVRAGEVTLRHMRLSLCNICVSKDARRLNGHAMLRGAPCASVCTGLVADADGAELIPKPYTERPSALSWLPRAQDHT